MQRLTLVFSALVVTGTAWCQDLPRLAAGILEQTKLAQSAIQVRDVPGALRYVQRAREFASRIQQETGSQIHPNLVPVSREVQSTATYRPVRRGKDEQMSADRIERGTSVRRVEADVSVEQLDVTNAAERLREAEDAVRAGDWETASSALGSIALIRTNSRGEAPLLKVRENLVVARTQIMDGKAKSISAPLRAAAEALADFSRSTTGAEARDAEAMRTQIAAYAQSVVDRHDDARQRVDNWLSRVEVWSRERSMLR